MSTAFSIEGRKIGDDARCFVIAEAGINHNGDLSLARKLIQCAIDVGCDAVKFQTYSVEHLVSPTAPMADYQARNTGSTESQADMLLRCQLTLQDHKVLQAECKRGGIIFLSTPFDKPSLDLLLTLKVTALKVSSGDITNTPFLKQLAASRLPLILSTGMANVEEIEAAAETIKAAGCNAYAFLHCVSAYPADPVDCNLRAMAGMAEKLNVPIGFSDHTTGIDIALASVAMGASILEKHITIDRTLPGPDHAASIEPHELKALMHGVRRIHQAFGSGEKNPRAVESSTADVARKSLHISQAICAGEIILEENIVAMRPGTGISPRKLSDVAGRRASQDIPAGAMLREDMLG
ncbi:MAG: N-acetylneuraminate synthase [Chthoniobacterales bacterium]